MPAVFSVTRPENDPDGKYTTSSYLQEINSNYKPANRRLIVSTSKMEHESNSLTKNGVGFEIIKVLPLWHPKCIKMNRLGNTQDNCLGSEKRLKSSFETIE